MPHLINESHLEKICSGCKKPHSSEVVLRYFHHKVYEIIECLNCGYETIRAIEITAHPDRKENIEVDIRRA